MSRLFSYTRMLRPTEIDQQWLLVTNSSNSLPVPVPLRERVLGEGRLVVTVDGNPTEIPLNVKGGLVMDQARGGQMTMHAPAGQSDFAVSLDVFLVQPGAPAHRFPAENCTVRVINARTGDTVSLEYRPTDGQDSVYTGMVYLDQQFKDTSFAIEVEHDHCTALRVMATIYHHEDVSYMILPVFIGLAFTACTLFIHRYSQTKAKRPKQGHPKKEHFTPLESSQVIEPDRWVVDRDRNPSPRGLRSAVQSKGTNQDESGDPDMEARMHPALGGHGQPGPPMECQDDKSRRKPASLEQLQLANERFMNVFEDPVDPDQE